MRKGLQLSLIGLFISSLALAQDLKVLLINSPSTACGHTGAEQVSITVFNSAIATDTAKAPFTIVYRVNGGSPVSQVITGAGNNIPGGQTKGYSFTTTVNMASPGIYNFKSWVILAADVDHSNDTLTKPVNSDANTIAGTVSPSDTVCTGSNGDTLFLSGNLGTVTNWILSTAGGDSVVGITDSFFVYNNLTQTTAISARVRNGTCPFDTSSPAVIMVDSATVPGTIGGTGNVCIGSNGTLTLLNSKGSVVDWETATSTGGPWTGASNTTLSFNYTNIQTTDDTLFRVRVKLGVCPEDTTPVGALTLDQPSLGGIVSLFNSNDTVCSGSNNGKLKLTGHRGTVQTWQVSILGGPFNPVGGTAGLDSITFSNITATSTYRAIVKNGACASIPSAVFTIQVDSTTIGGTINSNATVCSGTNSGTLNLVNKRGSVIKWEKSTNGGGTWTDVTPLNQTTSLTYNNLTTTTLFRAQVKNGSCSQIPSASATITVNSPSVGGTITTGDPTSVCAGNNTGLLTYSGGNGTVQDWEFSTNGGASWSSIGSMSGTHTYNNLTSTTLFRVKVQNAPCPVVYSDTMTITILPASVAGTIGGSATICSGSSVTLTLSGHSGTIKRWEVSTNGGTTFNTIAGSGGMNPISPVVTVNSLFRVIVQNGTCDSAITPNKSVTANPQTVPGSVTSNATVCGGNNMGTLMLNGHTGTVQNWIFSTDGGANWTVIAGSGGQTSRNYTNLTQTTIFRARVKSGVCPVDTSTGATITVTPAAIGGTASVLSANPVCAGPATVTLSTGSPATHSGTVIGWQFSINGGSTYTRITSPTTPTGTPAAFSFTYSVTTLFRAMVQNGASCDTLFSTPVTVTVNPPTVGGDAIGSTTVCGGSNNGFVTLTGHTGSVLKWQSSTNSGTTWSDEPNSDSVAFNYVGLNQNTWYRAIVKSGLCTQDTSDTAAITIIPAAIGGSVNYTGPNVCSGTNFFTLMLNGSSGTILRWERSINGVSWTNIGGTTLTKSDSNRTQTSYYRAVLQSGSCPSVNSAPDTVFVDPQSSAGTIAGSVTLCDTGNSGNVRITSYTGTIPGWLRQINGGGFSALGGSAGEDTINYSSLSSGVYQYKARVKSGVCPEDTSAVATIKVDPAAVGGTLSGGATYCTLTNSTLLTLSSYTDSVVRWQQSTNGGASFSNIGSSTDRDTFTFVNVTVPTIYRVIVSSGACGTDTSNTQTIGVGQSIAGTLSQSDSVCISGHTGLLKLSGYTGTIIGWQDSLSSGSWANHVPLNNGFDTLRYTNLTQTTSYRVIVQSGSCDPDTSNFVTITVSDTVFAGTLSQNFSFCDTTNNDTLKLSGHFGPILNWESAVNGGTFVPFSPVKTDSEFIFNNLKDSITQYRVIMNGGVCGSDTSNVVSVQVGASLGGILAMNDSVCKGNNAGVLRLTGYRGNILDWDSSTLIPPLFAGIGNTIDSLVYNNIDSTVTFRVRVQNPGCPPDTSNEITITSVPGTTAGTLLGSKSICASVNMDSVVLTGRVGNILLWEQSINNGALWDTVQGQLTDTLVYTNLTQTTWYRVVVQGAGICPDDTSNIAIIQIGPSDAGVITGDTHLCAGSTANLSLINYLGDVVGWESSIDGLNWTPIPFSDTNKIGMPVSIATQFRAIVQSDTCTADTSSAFLVNVDQPFVGSLITLTTQLCYGIGNDTIFISNPVDTVYDWEFRSDTSASYTSLNNDTTFQEFNNLIITTHYRSFVQNGICPVDTINITLIVDTFTVAGNITGNDTVCSNNNGGVIVLDNYIGNTFNWEASTDGGQNWSNAPGATNDTFYVYNNITDTTLYRIIVASGGCPPDTTDTVQIVVKPAAIGGLVQASDSFCKVPNNGVLNLNGYFGNILGWQQSIGGGPFANVSPSNTSDSLIYTNLDTTTSYRVLLSFGDCPDDTSLAATITILHTPVTGISPGGPTEFCEGESVVLTAKGGPTYLWSTTATASSITVSSTGNYTVLVTDTNTGCNDADTLTVKVFPLPTVDAGSDVTIFLGQSVNLSASGASSYEWTPKTALSDGFIPNPVASPTDTIVYFVVATDSNGCSGSDSVIVNVNREDSTGLTTFTNLFTPNGDGHNDYWRITQLANCATCNVAVYNRYGQEVYVDSDYQDDWTGTFNGKNLPDGTYYYVVTTEKGKIYKGALTILRGE